jgi:hypothetical protein
MTSVPTQIRVQSASPISSTDQDGVQSINDVQHCTSASIPLYVVGMHALLYLYISILSAFSAHFRKNIIRENL